MANESNKPINLRQELGACSFGTVQEPVVHSIDVVQEHVASFIDVAQEPKVRSVDIAQEPKVRSVDVAQKSVVQSIDVKQEPIMRSIDVSQELIMKSTDIVQDPAVRSIDVVQDLVVQDLAARSIDIVQDLVAQDLTVRSIDVVQKPVACSYVRPGFKRELAFALKVQSELDPTLGPTRLRKPRIPFCPTSTPSSSILDKRPKSAESSDMPRKRGKQVKAPIGDPSSPQSSIKPSISFMGTLAICGGQGGSNVGILIGVDSMPSTLKCSLGFNRPKSSLEIENLVEETLVPVPIMHAESPSEIAIVGNVISMKNLLAICKDKEVETHDLIKDVDKCEDSVHVRDTKKVISLHNLCQEPNKCQTILAQSNASSSSRLSMQTVESESCQHGSQEEIVYGKLTTKDLGLHKLVFEASEYWNVPVAYWMDAEKGLLGWIDRSGILCSHCGVVVSASKFEAHAGYAHRRKPYHNTYTFQGISLHQIALNLSGERRKQSDTLCQMCKTSGTLVRCVRCPRAYHKECAGLLSIPERWHCPLCSKMYKGRIPQAPQVQMVQTSKTKLSSCVLCRCTDFVKSGFGPRTVLLCDQCDKEYHIGCLKDNNMCDLKELPHEDWFCSNDCTRINTALKELDLREPEPLPDIVSGLIKKKCERKGLRMNANTDLSWKVIRGSPSAAKKPVLSRIVTIFHESFKPIKDDETGGDIFKAMVYGSKIGSHDFSGMNCVVLTVNSFVVSVAMLRVLGSEVAEMPLVATCKQDQRMGYFPSLFWCILRTLSVLGVKHFVVPAAKDAESYWTNKLGFFKIPPDQLPECTKDLSLMVFEGTSLLYKPIPAPQAFSEGSSSS